MRRELAWIGVGAGLLSTLALAAYGCGQTSSGSCEDTATCAATDSGGDHTAPDADAAPEAEGALDAGVDAADAGDGFDGHACDPTKTPAQDPCVISDMYGVFVSPTGRSGAAGTMSDPFSRVADAIAAATGESDRVLACAGSYDEALTLGSSSPQDAGSIDLQDAESEAAQEEAAFSGGVTLFGGLDCANGWQYTGAKAILAPMTRGAALTVKGLAVGLTFEDFGFHAVPATESGESSIAVFASGSAAPGLVLIRCELVAGAGQPGTDATAVMGFDAGAPPGQPGTANGGGGNAPNTCGGVAMASVGGAGGQPGAAGGDGQDGTPGPSNKGTEADCGGGNGSVGVGGGAGAGASSWAAFGQNGWVTTWGASGGPGAVGQGGGGGGSVDNSGGGAGGGAGGCGGAGGAPGTGGGSSVALLVYQSSVDLEQCSITTDNAGRGGNGATGEIGELGGTKGLVVAGTGCAGGKGGSGGSGGGGGGGAGGLSVGVLWSGTAPTIDGSPVGQAVAADAGGTTGTLSQVNVGTAGAAGMHGSGGAAVTPGANAGTDGTDGKPGAAAAVMEVQ
jgi:hypothetical protein